jgi:kynurenine 3-monooxygenase
MTTRACRRDVTIVGAGPVGIVLAILLAQRGYEVDVYEGHPDPRVNPRPGGRSINLTLAERGWQGLRAAGLEDVIKAMSLPLRGRMIHAADGELRFHPYTPAGDSIYSVPRSELTKRLLDFAEEYPEVSIRFGHHCRAVDVEACTVSIVTSGGERIDARPSRVLAADGAFSSVRRSLLRNPGFSFYQRLSPISYRELRVPPTAAGEFAFAPHALHLWPRGEGMIVGFPNLDRSFTISVFMPTQGETSFASLSDRRTLEAFMFTSCGDLLAHMDDVAHDFFNGTPAPLLSSGCAPWVHGGWLALIGDAAHTLVPFLGQGLNAGLEDCRTLAECLDDANDRWDKALAVFEDERLANGEAVIGLAEKHFDELARGARDPLFLVRRVIEERLHAIAPDRFVPLYTMVAFGSRPYREIAAVRARQEALLDRLMSVPDIGDRLHDEEIWRLARSELNALETVDESLVSDLEEALPLGALHPVATVT